MNAFHYMIHIHPLKTIHLLDFTRRGNWCSMDLSTVLLLSLSHLLVFSQTLAQSGPYTLQYTSCSNSLGNYTTDSPYQWNLNTLPSSLGSDNQVDYGFYNLSVGQSPDQVNSIALCRGDVPLNDCRGCIINATHKIIQDCPNQKEAIHLYDFCMTLYSNRSLLGIIGGFPTYNSSNPNNVNDPSTFNSALQDLLHRIQDVAASGGSFRKFATGNQTAGFNTIYGLVQCTPNLSQQQCSDCLDGIIQKVQDCCSAKVGGRVITPSCNLRFETKRFYGETFPPPQSPAPPGRKSKTTQTIIIVVSTVGGGIIIVVFICILIVRWRRSKKNVPSGYEPWQLNFDAIKIATNNFSDVNKIGQGGFSVVYEGIFNGQKIAVKRLTMGSIQGDQIRGDQKFNTERAILAQLQHINVVRLLGSCSEGSERLLVYEFVPKKTLLHYILVEPVKLDWKICSKIIRGIARGLRYLHKQRIIHRDIKASNVLLDNKMTPKISDFGIARSFSKDQTDDTTTASIGTVGYMAPEYSKYGQFSVKSDVYSYGVLVLKMLTGQDENVNDFLSSIWRNWKDDTFQNLIGPTLRTDGSMSEIMRCVRIALLCVQDDPASRPTMASVVDMLNSRYRSLSTPSKPHPPPRSQNQ